MKKKKGIPILVSFVVFSLLTAVPGYAQDKGDDVYVIKKGDTLWDLSGEFLTDPYQWPQLWQRNQYITNPHLIYPGNSLRLHGRPRSVKKIERAEGAVTEAERVSEAAEIAGIQKVVEESAVAEKREGVPSPEEMERPLYPEKDEAIQVLRKGHVELVILEEESQGMIIDARFRKRLLAQGDIVYIAIKERAPEVGEKFLIFRTMKMLRNPYTKKKGRKVYVLGALTVTAAAGVLYQAEITDSLDAIWRGDEVMTYRVIQ